MTWLSLLVSINLLHHSSWVQWKRLGLEQQLVCKTPLFSLGWITGHSSPAGSYEQFDSWGRFSHLSKPLIRSPMGRKNAFLVFTHCYRQQLGFYPRLVFLLKKSNQPFICILAFFHPAFLPHDFLGTLFFFFTFFFFPSSQTPVIFSHMCIATVKQSEFLPRPRLWITDCVKSRCGGKIANRRRGDAACLTRTQNRPVCFCMVPRTHVFDIRDTCTDRP